MFVRAAAGTPASAGLEAEREAVSAPATGALDGHSATRFSNRSVAEWGGVFGEAVVVTANLDRLLHHSRVITIGGDS